MVSTAPLKAVLWTCSVGMLCALALDEPESDAWREQDSVERETHGVPQGGQWFFRQVSTMA